MKTALPHAACRRASPSSKQHYIWSTASMTSWLRTLWIWGCCQRQQTGPRWCRPSQVCLCVCVCVCVYVGRGGNRGGGHCSPEAADRSEVAPPAQGRAVVCIRAAVFSNALKDGVTNVSFNDLSEASAAPCTNSGEHVSTAWCVSDVYLHLHAYMLAHALEDMRCVNLECIRSVMCI